MGREAIPSYMDVLDFPQELLEAMRNACILAHTIQKLSFCLQIAVKQTTTSSETSSWITNHMSKYLLDK